MSDKKKKKADNVSKKTASTTPADNVTQSTTPKSSSNGLFVVGIVVVAIIAVAGILLFGNKKSNTEPEPSQEVLSEKQSSTPQVPTASLTAETTKKQEPTPVNQSLQKTEESNKDTDKPAPSAAPSQTIAPALTATEPRSNAPVAVQGTTAPKIPALPKEQLSTGKIAAAPRRTGPAIPAAQQYKHISAQDFTGVRQPSVPRELAQATPRELTAQAYQQRIAEVPEELGVDADTPMGYMTLPGGGQQFIIYNDNQTVSKIFTVNSDGSKQLRELGDDGLVTSETTDGTQVTYSYKKDADGTTKVTITDQDGTPVYKRTYNETNMLVEETDLLEDDTFTYTYAFEGGKAISFLKKDTRGAEVSNGAVADTAKLRLQSLMFSAAGATKSYSYIRGEAGTINMIIENKGTSDEVIRKFDDDGKLVTLEKKKTGMTYTYYYNDNGAVIKITVTNADGETKDVDPNDPEFAFLENETEQFDPIEFTKGILEHKNIMQYYNQNMLYKRANQATQPQLPTADQLTTVPGVPAAIPSANLPPSAPASAPKAPTRAPARAPSAGPSIPRR